jgi:hypothetical protein
MKNSMLKEHQKEGFYVITLPSSNLAAPLSFDIALNTSVGVETILSHRALGSTTPNWWSLLDPHPNMAPLIVTMMLWK